MGLQQRFFKVMMPGFEEKLNLPPAFCEKIKEPYYQAIIKSRLGTWKIQVSQNQKGLICFRDGWPEFVRCHGLSFAYFLLFEHTGDLKFNVSIFDTSACEKNQFLVDQEHPQEVNPSQLSRKKPSNKECAGSCPCQSKTPSFRLTIKSSHVRKRIAVNIPRAFGYSDYMRGKTKVILRDPRGREWPMELRFHSGERCRLAAKGWNKFFVGNDLKLGDECVFHLSSMESLGFMDAATTVILDTHIIPASS